MTNKTDCLKCFYFDQMPSGNRGCLNYGDINTPICTMFRERKKAEKIWKEQLKRRENDG